MADGPSNLDGFRASVDARERAARFRLDAFKAVNDVQIRWLDAQGQYQLRMVQVLQGRIAAARDAVRLRTDQLQLRELRIKLAHLDRERRRVAREAKIVDRQISRLRGLFRPRDHTGYGVIPTNATKQALAEGAFRYFYRRASAVARRAIDDAGDLTTAVEILVVDAEEQAAEYEAELERLFPADKPESPAPNP